MRPVWCTKAVLTVDASAVCPCRCWACLRTLLPLCASRFRPSLTGWRRPPVRRTARRRRVMSEGPRCRCSSREALAAAVYSGARVASPCGCVEPVSGAAPGHMLWHHLLLWCWSWRKAGLQSKGRGMRCMCGIQRTRVVDPSRWQGVNGLCLACNRACQPVLLCV